jgi:CO/xanthine dehydrogenase FAD-binding subunit
MTIARFEYFAPEAIEEACRLLLEKGDGAVVMAGGTDLLIKIRYGQLKPRAIIGLKRIKDLHKITFHKKTGLSIGAMALLADVAAHPAILKHYPAIAYAAQETANVQIRNMGTLAGNLCNGAPSADNAPGLLAMGAELTLTDTRGERQLPLEQFFKGPGLTGLEQGEILTSIHVPPPPPLSGASYMHISPRGKVDISAVGVAAMIVMDNNTCKAARIALGAVAPIPMRAISAEDLLRGKKLTSQLMERAGKEAARESNPITDLRATAEYRRKMVEVLTKRALTEARERVKAQRAGPLDRIKGGDSVRNRTEP